MLVTQWEAWPANASGSQEVDLAKDWVPSPEGCLLPKFSGQGSRDRGFSQARAAPDEPSIADTRRFKHVKHVDPSTHHSSRLSFRRWKDWLAGSRGRKINLDDLPPSPRGRRQVTHADWKAYGDWARPRIGNVYVRNATPPPVPRKLTRQQVEAIILCFKRTDRTPCEETWIARAEHPSLPPRPDGWPTPPSSRCPTPPQASDLQLNPFLEHRPFGTPPILMDLRLAINGPTVFLGAIPPDKIADFPMFLPKGPNGAQPATYPGVSSLTITAVADDPLAVFPWPFTVLAHHPSLPVTVQDVLNATQINFDERMTQEEVESLQELRQGQIFRSYRARMEFPFSEDGLKRTDYLGDRCMFRGLGPAPDGESFMMFVGPP